MFGKLKKLTIVSYSESDFAEANKKDQFVAMINPATYSVSYGQVYQGDSTIANQDTVAAWVKQASTTFSFELIIDGTGVLNELIGVDPSLRGMSVQDQIDQFLKTVYDYDKEIHSPRYLEVRWGGLFAQCVLTSLSITYKLFATDGSPLRASLNCSFRDNLSEETRKKRRDELSPDISHEVTVRKGDNLQLLCGSIYGDPSYYIEVARFNKILNYRNLVPGQKILFPPLKK